MTNIVFVHGTGVRNLGYQHTFKQVKTSLKQLLPEARVHPCYWGDLGAAIGIGASIPGYPQKMATEEEDHFSEEMAWSTLLHDPLVELRVLATQTAHDDVALGQTPAHQLLGQLDKLRQETVTATAEWPCMPDSAMIKGAIDTIRDYAGTEMALDVVLNSDGDLVESAARVILARAIVAGWMSELLDAGYPTPLGDARDSLVRAIAEHLGASRQQVMGLLNDAAWALMAPIRIMARATIADPSLRAATWAGRRFRESLANMATPAIGDVVLYQARGKPIRDKILQVIDDIGEPVVLIAHSLGGIACIDLLIEAPRPQIKAIVTVGTQAPFLHEIGALSSLAKAGAMPGYMRPWLNFYDKNDILSFMASPVMHGSTTVTDIEVKSKQPFPASHSAYWTNPVVWTECAEFLQSFRAD